MNQINNIEEIIEEKSIQTSILENINDDFVDNNVKLKVKEIHNINKQNDDLINELRSEFI